MMLFRSMPSPSCPNTGLPSPEVRLFKLRHPHSREIIGKRHSHASRARTTSAEPAGADQARLVGDDYQLGPVSGPELAHRPAHVRLRRGRTDEQAPGDLLVREPLGRQSDNLSLSISELSEAVRGLWLLRPCSEFSDQLLGHARREQRLADRKS